MSGDQINLAADPVGTAFDPRPFLELRVWASTFSRIQRDRIALNNGLRSDAIPREIVSEIIENYSNSEKMVGLAMRRAFRRTAPDVYKWLKTDAAVGIGEHLMARLLGTIGHPVHAQPYFWQGEGSDRVLMAAEPFDRNVAKLWAYCGVGDPERKRRVGMTAEDATALGNPRAKVLVRLIAEGCVKCVGTAVSLPESSQVAPTDTTNLPGTIEDTKKIAEPSLASSPLEANGPAEHLTPSLPTDPSPTDSTRSPISERPAESVGEFLPDATIEGLIPEKNASHLADSTDDATRSATAIKGSRRRSPYRDIYDDGRRVYADREGWTLMHQHNAALRLVSKEILKDLWVLTKES